jgi:tetratricopeptide (TPR) repeat protein
MHFLGAGQFGKALTSVRSALDVATSIGHLEWIAAAHIICGAIYVELLSPELARPEIEQGLALAGRLQSGHWANYATDRLAAAWCECCEPSEARAALARVLTPPAPMDTIHRRACWARLAELALIEGEPANALDIVDRLIVSAPGMTQPPDPGRPIPHLWRLKGKALAALGYTNEARALLEIALLRAQELGVRLEIWRLHADLGRLYAAAGLTSQATTQRVDARQCIRTLAETVPEPALRLQYIERADALLT